MCTNILEEGQVVRTIVDCLWYFDGPHEKLKKQSCTIPAFFECFTGYNMPELSKHRKRRSSNMSSSVLNFLPFSLFQNLQASFLSNLCFQRLHQQTQSLALGLAGYVDYLSSQNKINESHPCLIKSCETAFRCIVNQVCAPMQ